MMKRAEFRALLTSAGDRQLGPIGHVRTSWPDTGWVCRPAPALEVSLSFQGLTGGGTDYATWLRVRRWDLAAAMARVIGAPGPEWVVLSYGGSFFDCVRSWGLGSLDDVSLFPPGMEDDEVAGRVQWCLSLYSESVFPWLRSMAGIDHWMSGFPRIAMHPSNTMLGAYATGNWLLGRPVRGGEFESMLAQRDSRAIAKPVCMDFELSLSDFLSRLDGNTPSGLGVSVCDFEVPPMVTKRPKST